MGCRPRWQILWWNSSAHSWHPLAGEARASPRCRAGVNFAIRRDGELAYFDGLHFLPLGLLALDVATDRNGLPLCYPQRRPLVRKVPQRRPGSTRRAERAPLAVGSDDSIWIARAARTLLKWQNGQAETCRRGARTCHANDDRVIAVDGNGNIQLDSVSSRVEPKRARPMSPPSHRTADIRGSHCSGSIYTRAVISAKERAYRTLGE